jgi:hypothetical protein
MLRCPRCGAMVRPDATFCTLCHAPLTTDAGVAPVPAPSAGPAYVPVQPGGGTAPPPVVRRLAAYARWSAVLWLCLGLWQAASAVLAPGLQPVLCLVGAWNIFAARSRLRLARCISLRAPVVPRAFPGVVQLAIVAVINLRFGGYLGLLFVALDLYARNRALAHAHLFDAVPPAAAGPAGGGFPQG